MRNICHQSDIQSNWNIQEEVHVDFAKNEQGKCKFSLLTICTRKEILLITPKCWQENWLKIK